MPFALETNRGGLSIGRSRFTPCDSICDDQGFPEDDDSDCSDASSIGRNSAASSEDEDSDREDSGGLELKKSPLDTMNNLEEDLPVKKGISQFYSGKSKSYTSLADAAAVTSVQEMVKPEDPYAKKRKNLLARNYIARSHSCAYNLGGISKRSPNIGGGKSCLNLSSSEEGKSSSTSLSPPCPLPPLHPHPYDHNNKSTCANKSQPPPPLRNPLRSYSWTDMHSVVAEAHEISGLAICSGNEGNKVH